MRRRSCYIVVLLLSAGVSAADLDRARTLEREGRLREARDELQAAVKALSLSDDRARLAEALSSLSRISVSLGAYPAAIQEAEEVIALRRKLNGSTSLADDLNTLGLANQYLGRYEEALTYYESALREDVRHADAEGEITRKNNIGNVYYFQGRYSDALAFYNAALDRVNATAGAPWNAWRRQLTLANLATLHQRLGQEQKALDLYRRMAGSARAMPVSEQAQVLLNEGALYRRLGDPVKALELYHAAQSLFQKEHHSDGEIGALRNIGIVRVMDLDDLSGALDTFTAAVKLCRQSSNGRGFVQNSLYRAEVLRRLGRFRDAENDVSAALEAARKSGLTEDEWKGLYTLGRIAEDAGHTALARERYEQSIRVIESMRAGLRQASLKTDFLADKRDVYDAFIALMLRGSSPSAPDLWRWIERTRARTLLERTSSHFGLAGANLAQIQNRLPPGTAILEYWMGSATGAAICITNSSVSTKRLDGSDAITTRILAFQKSLQAGSDDWRNLSRTLGGDLLAGLHLPEHVVIVPDGALNLIPFEALTIPRADRLLIEKSDVFYLPSAQMFVAPKPLRATRRLPPWRTELVAFGDPQFSGREVLEDAAPLPASGNEIRSIAGMLDGRAQLHLGQEARKDGLLRGQIENVPVVHLSTHASVDLENPDHSRIVFAAKSRGGPPDYLFDEEIYHLNLKGVDLVTLSACDTARGKVVRGEGMQSFTQGFLAAGASSTITSLWRVSDQPASSFMQQLYYSLARGETKAAALRRVKLEFLQSHSALAEPRYWAPFILTGDGLNAAPRAVSWSVLLLSLAVVLAIFGFGLLRFQRTRAASDHGCVDTAVNGENVPVLSSPRKPNI